MVLNALSAEEEGGLGGVHDHEGRLQAGYRTAFRASFMVKNPTAAPFLSASVALKTMIASSRRV